MRELGRAQDAAELERLRWVAEETREWEQREARLVRRVEELERNTLPVPKPTAVTEGAGSYETRPREQTAACINQREMLMTEASFTMLRWTVRSVTSGCGCGICVACGCGTVVHKIALPAPASVGDPI